MFLVRCEMSRCDSRQSDLKTLSFLFLFLFFFAADCSYCGVISAFDSQDSSSGKRSQVTYLIIVVIYKSVVVVSPEM